MCDGFENSSDFDHDRGRSRGQSELLGYLLIFAIVVLAVAVVGTTGFAGLDSAEEYQQTVNVEQAFTVLADNTDDVVRHGVPGRTTEISIAEASLSLNETEAIAVTVDGDAVVEEEFQPIVYDSGSGTTIAYTSGALVRQDEGHSVMFRDPGFVLTNETVLVPIVATNSAGDRSVSGTTAVGIQTRHAETDVAAMDDPASEVTVTIEVTSSRIDAWERYLDGEPAVDCAEPSDQTVECEVDTERVHVTVDRVDVRFQ